MRGKFVMVDGLDGSGKGTIVDAMKEWAIDHGVNVLDLRDFCRENSRFPNEVEISSAAFIFSAEPTFCMVGQAIREELVRNTDTNYSAMTIAQAFSLDREILYKRVIIPALKLGKNVIQERGVISSLVYQPAQDRIQVSELLKLTGNRLALLNAPDTVIIAKVSAETVVRRLKLRTKKDDSIFDSLAFQRKLESRYTSDWLKTLFEKQGSTVMYMDTDDPKTPEDTKEEAKKLMDDLF